MSIDIANYPDPQGASGDVIAHAYMYIVQTDICYTGNTSGLVTAYIYRSAAAAAAGNVPNIDQIQVALGEVMVSAVSANPDATPPVAGSPATTFPTLTELATNAATIQAANPGLDPFGAFRLAVYEGLKLHPKISGYTLADVA